MSSGLFKPSGIITLTTDFGADNFYVAEMKAAILRVFRQATLVDVTHSVPPQEISVASWLLLRTIQAFDPGAVHICVVDPGVGSDRRIAAIEIARQVVIAPDNGLFGVLRRLNIDRAYAIENQALFGSGHYFNTFHGRDIMAPVAAHLMNGVSLSDVGSSVDADSLLSLEESEPNIGQGNISGRVVYLDAFGNAITNIRRSAVPSFAMGDIVIQVGSQSIAGIRSTYSDGSAGDLIALFGSSDLLELAVVNGNAHQTHGISIGDPVDLKS